MERVRRIELPSLAWKADVLPLNYTRINIIITQNNKNSTFLLLIFLIYGTFDMCEWSMIMEKNKKRFGDRRDAKRIRNLSGLAQICIDLKPNRSVSDVFINQKMDVTILSDYVEKKKKEGMDLSYFHIFVSAIGKLMYSRPRLNYFVANRHLYAHNEVIISFVAKISFDDHSEEMMLLIPIEPDDTLETISQKIKDKVDAIRNKKIQKEGANDAIDFFGKLPNVLRVPVVGIFKWCDRKGLLPSSLIQDNLYYSSLIVSNLGSIKCGSIFHNITNFGTASGLLTMGEIHPEEIIKADGSKELKKICEFGINLDERIADGYYFAKSINLLQYVFDHPEILENKVGEIIDMGEIR